MSKRKESGVNGTDPKIIHFLKTCDISVLEDALIYRNEKISENFKDWVCRKNSEIVSRFVKPKLKAVEVEVADNEFFFKSKKYKSILHASQENGFIGNMAFKYAIDTGRHRVKRRSHKKKMFYIRPVQ